MKMELRGREVIAARLPALAERARLLTEAGRRPTLALVRLGEKPDDLAYERQILRRAEAVGIQVRAYVLPVDAPAGLLTETARQISDDPTIHGCLLFRPLGDPVAEAAFAAELAPEKDVDGMTRGSLARIYAGSGTGFAPCTAEAVFELLDHYEIPLEGANVTLVGRSLVIGRPAALLAMHRNATVTVCHSRSRDLAAACRRADILIVAVGRRGLIQADCLQGGQVIIDVGIHVLEDGSITGDVDPAVLPDDCRVTPVPGGLGPVTTLSLARHVIEAAEGR
ncbi:MAG: bifunctional 5,10-methylenetetrahydrofolate dehydrogenase/5,10-methenyltetrahydrofolate cyclohydrolase [Bacillota bacterium]|nr:bifunctional 5,10-methylenetetrahydrofolate dehydrogenase/5,10-methenyltetrahydrofolate cyclohydrolase [Bacillota bacterium]